MIDAERNLLSIKPYYLLTSTITEKPYLDEERACYLFETKGVYELFLYANKQLETITKLEQDKNFTAKEYCSDFYSFGVKKIKVYQKNKEIVTVQLTLDDARNTRFQYYNNDVNGNLLLLMQTKKKRYLKQLRTAEFFTPALVKERSLKQYPQLRYCLADANNKHYYLLFSTIQEFDEWNSSQDGKWRAIETTLSRFGRIRKTNSILLNPLSHRLLLTNNDVKITITKDDCKNKQAK